MKLIDSEMLATLQSDGENSPRRRANNNFHDDMDAKVQRLFISMESDSYVRPHYHPESFKWEFFLVLQGSLDFLLFESDGVLKERITLSSEGPVKGLEIPAGTWHCTVVNDNSAQFLEVKEGPYIVSNDKNFASWSPPEGDSSVADYLTMLKRLKVGQAAKL